VLLEAFLFVASFVVLKFPKYSWMKSYLLGIVLGSSAGFVIANILLWVVSVLPSFVSQKYSLPEFIQTISKYILAFGLLLGPIFASAGGLAVGSIFAVYFVYRRQKIMKKQN
jgi:hypothetical protein